MAEQNEIHSNVFITPDMIAAGVAAFQAWDNADEWSLEKLAEAIYTSMARAFMGLPEKLGNENENQNIAAPRDLLKP